MMLTVCYGFVGRAMEEDHAEDCPVLPRCLLLHLLLPQLPGLGPEILGSSAIWHPVCPMLPVVWHFCASGVCWLLLWIQITSL